MYFHEISLFWKKHPALFYGLVLFLGYIFVLQSPLAIFPFLLLLHPQKLLSAILIFLFPCFLIPKIYHFPCPGEEVEGIFYIHSQQKMQRFGEGWDYYGVLKTKEGRLHCHCFSKQYHTPKYSYGLKGKIKALRGNHYRLKINSNWELHKQRVTLAHLRFEAQSCLKRYIERHIKQERAAQFLTGITIGQMENQLMRNEFGSLGLSHLMAISGLHFSLLALFFHLFLRLFLPFKIEALCLILLLSCYFLFIGFLPSIFRAWSVTMIFLVGTILERKSSSLNALGIAMLLSLTIQPLFSTSLSFLLSFLATGGILFFYKPSQQLMQWWLPKKTLQEVLKKSRIRQCGYIVVSLFRDACALNLAVHLALFPYLIALFHNFPVSSLIYNLFFPFLASLALLFFIASIVLGHWAHFINGYYCDWILKIIESPPVIFKSIDIPYCPNWLLTLALTLLLCIAIGLKIAKPSKNPVPIQAVDQP